MKKTKLVNSVEITTLLIFMSLLVLIMIYHEPWYDEAEAWLISRDSSIMNTLFHILRYEGHPPLWYLCLYIPSHLGVPYEIGLKAVNFIFISLTSFLIIKKSPFPLWIRLMLPFTYFFFYQYGVISRSYSLLAFVLFLVAHYFPTRNVKPLRFALLLAGLGGVTMHGTIFAFGIAVAWFLEIIKTNRKNDCNTDSVLKKILCDKRVFSLVILGLINVIYYIILKPTSEGYTVFFKSFKLRDIIYKLFFVPLNAVISNTSTSEFSRSPAYCIMLTVLFIIMISFLFLWAFKNNLSFYVLIPYLLTSLFMSLIYFTIHHTGIYTLMFVFFFWIMLGKGGKPFNCHQWIFRLFDFLMKYFNKHKIFKVLLNFCLVMSLLIQLLWTYTASLNEIRYPYAQSRDLNLFIKENHLEGRKILNVTTNKRNYFIADIISLPYTNYNIFYNHNFGRKHMTYVFHSKNYLKKGITKKLVKNNKPDFIISVGLAYKDLYKSLHGKDYIPVEVLIGYNMWKYETTAEYMTIYMKKNLQSQYPKLKPILTFSTDS